MIKFLKNYGWAMYLGAALSFLGYGANAWKFYAVIIPVALLAAWSKYEE